MYSMSKEVKKQKSRRRSLRIKLIFPVVLSVTVIVVALSLYGTFSLEKKMCALGTEVGKFKI